MSLYETARVPVKRNGREQAKNKCGIAPITFKENEIGCLIGNKNPWREERTPDCSCVCCPRNVTKGHPRMKARQGVRVQAPLCIALIEDRVFPPVAAHPLGLKSRDEHIGIGPCVVGACVGLPNVKGFTLIDGPVDPRIGAG